MTSVLVIGAGVGGITTAAQLAHNGFKVTVVEKCDQPGGRCGYIEKDGHRFDTGPTLYLMPELYSQAFALLGEQCEHHLDLIRIDPSYHIHFSDGSTLNLTSDLNSMGNQLEAFEPGSFEGYLRYLNEGRKNYELAIPNFAQRNFRSPFEFFNLKNFLLLLQAKGLIKHYDNVGRYFKSQRLRQAFTFQDMYVGLSPFNAPAMFSMLQYAELVDGVWLPKGGMYSLVEALVSVAIERGVQFVLDTAVEEISVNVHKTTGVRLSDGQYLEPDIVVANADLPYVYRELLSDEETSRQIDRKKFTCSTLMLFWGIDKPYPQLRTHNLFLGGDYQESFACIFDDLGIPEEPSFYIHTPVRVDPSMAPTGQDSLSVIIPVGHINEESPQDWDYIKKKAKTSVINRLRTIGVDDIEEHIKFEFTLTPPDWKNRYNLARGSTHGLSHGLLQMGYLRPHNRHKKIRNLYFVGASTHPGTGLPTVLLSARLTTERILEENGA